MTFADTSDRREPANRRTLASTMAAAWLAFLLAAFAPSLALASIPHIADAGVAIDGAGDGAERSGIAEMSAPDSEAALRDRALGRRQAAHEAKIVTRTGVRTHAALHGAGTVARRVSAPSPVERVSPIASILEPRCAANGRDTHLRIGVFLI